jgi:peptidoglycan hydrolase CwlO-like protein
MANQIKKKYLDQEVISYFDDQIDAVEASVTAEESARIAADQALQGEIDAAEGRLDIAEGEIDTLQSEMDAVEGRLDTAEGEIDTLQSEMDAAEGRLDTVESTLLVKADLVGGLVPANQLPSYVDDVLEFADLASFPVEGELGKIYVAVDTNKVYRWSGSNYIQITSGAVDTVNGQNGVVVLDAADIQMVSEATSVESKLVSLQGEIDAAEADIADHETRITALETSLAPTWNKVKFDLTSTDISNGYIDLAHESIANSISAFVDRLAIHESDDFTLSVVGGVTRITFAGALVSPGQSTLDANDNIYVRYQYLA